MQHQRAIEEGIGPRPHDNSHHHDRDEKPDARTPAPLLFDFGNSPENLFSEVVLVRPFLGRECHALPPFVAE